MMNKLLFLMVSLLLSVGMVSLSWAHGSKGRDSGSRGHSVTKPAVHKQSRSHPGGGFRQHLRQPSRKFLPHSNRRPLSRKGILTRSPLPRVANGTLLGKRGFLRNRRLFNPLARPFNRNFGVRIQGKALEKEESLQPSEPAYSSEIYFNKNPNPWFLYGKGNEFRHMGLIPPLSETSRDLE